MSILSGRKEIKIAVEDLKELAFIANEDGTNSSNLIRKAIKRYLRSWRKENPDEHERFKNQIIA